MTTDESAAARPLVYAHRGSSEAFAEHTRAAYLQAIADGADGVECDVHLTRDQHAVLLHDATLDRTSDGTGQVADRTLEELRLLDFSSWKGARIPEAYRCQVRAVPDPAGPARHPARCAVAGSAWRLSSSTPAPSTSDSRTGSWNS